MAHEQEEKFWIPRFQTWASQSELLYIQMQASDHKYLVRETPSEKMEAWMEDHRQTMSYLR